MKFEQLLEKLKRLNLPSEQYAIFGSGPMAVRDLKEANDIDLIVTQNYNMINLKVDVMRRNLARLSLTIQ